MNAHELTEHREADSTAGSEVPSANVQSAVRVEHQSIRVRLDASAGHRCDGCGGDIGDRTRYRNVTVREGDGGVADYSFCDEDCLAARFPRLD